MKDWISIQTFRILKGKNSAGRRAAVDAEHRFAMTRVLAIHGSAAGDANGEGAGGMALGGVAHHARPAPGSEPDRGADSRA